ncbi:MAG: hypothetical protein HY321_11860 [Armatimonadetes bacterium]|nr:hypothetical protein [Armatimonadota bacterium]
MRTLTNSKVRLTFDDEGRLMAMEDASGAVQIPIDPGALTHAFALVLRSAPGHAMLVTPQAPPQVVERPDALVFQWRVVGGWGRVDVVGKVVLPPDSPFAEWTVGVRNQTDCALWEVVYPRISGLQHVDGSELAKPRRSGELVPNPVAVVNGPDRPPRDDRTRAEYGDYDVDGTSSIAYSYPGMWTLQFLAFGQPKTGGIYFAAHDGQALYKRFGMYPDGGDGKHAALAMKQCPEDRTALGGKFASFYPTAVGVYQGPWWGASAIYREWATRQRWCQKGPTKDRTDISPKAKELDLWYWNYRYATDSRPRTIVPLIRYLREKTGCNMGFHWYSFNGEIYSRWRVPWGPPDNEDIRNVLVRGVRELRELGVLVIPYLDCRLWSSETKSFQDADGMKWIARDANGEGTTWPTLGPAWTMCPTAPPFHDLTSRLVGELMDKCELDGAYLDQVTACNVVPCFNEEHDHAPGGHDHWVRGYRKMLERIQREIKQRSPTSVITSEGYIECFLDLFDLDLGYALNYFCEEVPGMVPIPLFQSVYHDYHLTYGSTNRFPDASIEKFRYCDALLLVGGGQLGVCGVFAGGEERAAFRPRLDWVETLTRAHMAARRWFNLGVWKPPLAMECDRVTIEMDNWSAPRLDVPTGVSGCFELDGELCVALVNHTDRPRRAAFDLSPRAHGLKGAQFEVCSVHPGAESRLGRLDADGARQEVTLDALSVQLWMVRPAEGN